jgi:RimJ/RimL family protein N-acetyltransferase
MPNVRQFAQGESALKIAETARLLIRRLETGDAEFIHRLVNEPSWIRYIGDKGVKTLEDARRYIETGPLEMYQRLGFGLYLVALKGRESIGICGLIKRPALADVDLGFAFLPGFWGKGYAFEAAAAVMSYGKQVLGLSRIVAILSPDNERSANLLEKLGFRPETMLRMDADGEELRLYAAA